MALPFALGRWRWQVVAFGVGLGGGYCTPPNQHDVSVANSLFPFTSGRIFELSTGLACVFKFSVFICVPRARSYYALPRKVRNSGLKVRNSGLKVRNSGLKVKQKQLDESPLKVRNSGLKVKQKQLDESPLKVRNSGLKVKQKQLDESLTERSLSHAKDSKNSP
ncbi:hypothetical protein [Candidatus Contendibacter odensensis]|uniref:hypothetical protein n=1 Tax=Candidatus Contendibacter odensensis TaxID=1400860 RepID=UPI0012B69217|nr:hypothetical protein [Candidatus Contendobacter odensis]